jgi:hypothetical protein
VKKPRDTKEKDVADLVALIETMEILADPAAMAAIADAEANRGKLYTLDEIPD